MQENIEQKTIDDIIARVKKKNKRAGNRYYRQKCTDSTLL